MAKKSKLFAALDIHRGRDYKIERQRELQKKAAKKLARNTDLAQGKSAMSAAGVDENFLSENDYDWESDKSNEMAIMDELCTISPACCDRPRHKLIELHREFKTGIIVGRSPDKDGDIGSEPSGIPLSDLEVFSEADTDIIPYQRLTINNFSALIKAQQSIVVPLSNVPFSEHQSVTSASQTSILDVNDDLNRELAFYKQSLDAVNEARSLLKSEGIALTRPSDYYAEMVKTDEHMGKIKLKMIDEAANKKAAAEARKQRDLKKFGKQVQASKLQARDKSKRDMLETTKILKRKRRNTEIIHTHEEDLFDVALADIDTSNRARNMTENCSESRVHNKRQRKDAKFGFGGKKRFLKSGDALSSADIKSFSVKKMKRQTTAAPRLGGIRRAKRRVCK